MCMWPSLRHKAQIMTGTKSWQSARSAKNAAHSPIYSASDSTRQLQTIKWKTGLLYGLYRAHKHHIYISTVTHWTCHLFDYIIQLYFTPKTGVDFFFLFSSDSLLALFTVFPRNRCCCAEDRLELKLQNAFGILTPMFPVYRIIFLCGAYFLVGGQSYLWMHFCVRMY